MYRLQKIEKVYHHLDVNFPVKLSHVYLPQKRSFFSGDIHYDLQMILILSGRQDVIYSEYENSFSAGQVWWTAPWEPHAGRVASDYFSMLVITIAPEFLGYLDPFQEIDWLVPFVLPPAQRPNPVSRELRLKVLLLARAIIKLERNNPYGWRTLQWFRIHEIIILMNQLILPQLTKEGIEEKMSFFRKVMPAIQAVKSSPLKSISLDDAAQECSMGRSHFCYIFKQAMGVSFSNFALHARISIAAQALRNQDSSIKEVAQKHGFKDVSHFYHVFKKYFKCTPNEYISKLK